MSNFSHIAEKISYYRRFIGFPLIFPLVSSFNPVKHIFIVHAMFAILSFLPLLFRLDATLFVIAWLRESKINLFGAVLRIFATFFPNCCVSILNL